MKKAISFTLLFSLLLSVLLSGCSGPEERAWQKGQKALAEENFSEAAAAFAQAGSRQDAEQLLAYAEAAQNLENGNYSEAETAFLALGDFKDCVLMSSYCKARECEETAFSTADADAAVSACADAYQLYTDLSLFRDCDDRAANCRELLYSKASEWMSLGRYEDAASAFSALGGWQDSAGLETYCRASALENGGSYAAAAELFTEIPGVLDADERAASAYGQAYQHALALREQGDYEAALSAFSELGDYRDAEAQAESTTVLGVRNLIRAGSEPLRAFLDGFVNTWMSAHAGIMQGFFSRNLLQPYIESGSELDTLIQSELNDESYPANYGFVFYGNEVQELLTLDDGFTLAKVKGSASWYGPEGPVEKQETLQVLIDTRNGRLVAAAVLSANA